jgi:hypothetical protein
MKNLVVLHKEGKFKPNCQNDQLAAALQSEEHQGRIQVVSLMASWKEGFLEDIEQNLHPVSKEEEPTFHCPRIPSLC